LCPSQAGGGAGVVVDKNHRLTLFHALPFNARFEVLLYDLTSTYLRATAFSRRDKRRYGYSRDKRSDACRWSSH